MKIIIDIDEDVYKDAKEHMNCTWKSIIAIHNALNNCIPLPKNHGRLIDVDQLMNYCQNQIDGHKYADCNVIARFPTILGAEVSE